jgi:protein-disulfide isomerase
MAAEQTRAFSPDRCTAMLSRYAVTAQGAQRYAEGKAALIARGQYTPHGPAPSLGNPDAPITLVIFSDFDDPEGGRAAPVATAIKNLYADRVRLVFRQFPLATHANGHLAAEASLAAQAQGKFWALYDVMFGNPQDHGRSALERYAKAAGLDMKAFRRALDEKTFAADVDADLELGRKLGIGAVPAMFANGKSVSIPYGADELAALVEKTASP